MTVENSSVQMEHIYARLARELEPHLSEFGRCRSTAELRHLASYQRSAEHVREMLTTLDMGDFRRATAGRRHSYRCVAWNIERGTQLTGQLEALRAEERLRDADVILLVEADLGMARSDNLNVTRTIAKELGFAYAFAPCYLSLVKGSGVEYDCPGENELGLHGNAILSRYPIRNVRQVALVNGVDMMKGREKRLGSQTAVVAEIEFPNLTLAAVSVHLDMQSSQRHRADQMRSIIDAIPQSGPAIIGGDWNTSTYDSSHAFYSIVGFFRRLMMGVDYTIRNHYVHPERWFERGLFRLLESRGFDYRRCNVMGERTSYYAIDDLRATGSLREWVPAWCLHFIRWALRNHDGKCPFKLDWFATRGVAVANPFVIHNYRHLSDHDAIGVDIVV